MRTTKTKVTFRHSFTLNRNVGELPAGTYNIETDEEEMILTSGRTPYRQTAVYFFVEKEGSTGMLSIEPADFHSALNRDEETRAASALVEGNGTLTPGETSP